MNEVKKVNEVNSEKDNDIESKMGMLLRAGVISSAVIVFTGAVLYIIRYGAQVPDYSTFIRGPEDFSTLTGIFKSLTDLRSRGIIMFGLVILILTPVARVTFSLIAFAIQKDYIYMAISAIVLVILLSGFGGIL